MERTNSNLRNFSYLLIGGGIGATLALLFAPKSGSEMREDISIAANNGVQKTKETVSKLRDNAGEYYETARESAANYYETAKGKANDIYSAVANKTEELADKSKELPEKAESFIEEKFDQIDSAVQAHGKEFKKKANNA